jgi:hypothetical protein
MYCERLEPLLMSFIFNNSHDESSLHLGSFLSELNCLRSFKYALCLQKNFRVKCQTTFGQAFNKIELFNGKCAMVDAKNKQRPTHIKNGASFFQFDLKLIICFFIFRFFT